MNNRPIRSISRRRSSTGMVIVCVAGLVVLAGSSLGTAQAASGRAAASSSTTLISVSSGGEQGVDYRSEALAVSASGRYVAFTSAASNLVPGDTNETWDVFVRDRWAATTARISESSAGVQANSSSYGLMMSPDGRYILFGSDATNLVRGDTNAAFDVYLWDRRSGLTSRVSLSDSGGQLNASTYGGAISADGRYVTFNTAASDVGGGRDANEASDVFVRDRVAGTTRRVSQSNGGGQANGASDSSAISADGQFVTFTSEASNLVRGDANGFADIFVWDRRTSTTSRVTRSADGRGTDNGSTLGGINSDGRYITFTSDASNLVAGDTNGFGDIFLWDRQTDTISRMSLTTAGGQSNDYSYAPAINADGRYVAFSSYASNLVPTDTNNLVDAFLRDRLA